jgi:50S ribosomal subunit-associated GTPase HflX
VDVTTADVLELFAEASYRGREWVPLDRMTVIERRGRGERMSQAEYRARRRERIRAIDAELRAVRRARRIARLGYDDRGRA